MTDIPHARRLIAQARAEIKELLDLLDEAESLMTRPAPIRKAPRTSQPITQRVADDIRAYAYKHPRATYRMIGAHFKVDGGRVSEVLRGLR